ncbi:PQ loop repeat-domain-containing protein [Parasitella parasitica]|nr:PQ loop repeat-domain-containing protein [Parasitella parasitica]
MNHTFVSSLAGYLSIVCWLIVFTPQLWENYQRKSGDGLSMTFLVIWLAGDVFNLLGVIMQDLLVTMFVLALYYTVADMCLIWQVIHYQQQSKQVDEDIIERLDESRSLLNSNTTTTSYSNTPISSSNSFITIAGTTNNSTSGGTKLFNLTSAVSIVLVTVISCYTYFNIHWKHNHDGDNGNGDHLDFLPQLMGWSSAVLYVGSRIPQILKNWRNKSTEGLSFGMFICAVMGNVFFTMSIFLKSTNANYILMNLSWVIGSCGTLIFDFLIFTQFFVYSKEKKNKAIKGKLIV